MRGIVYDGEKTAVVDGLEVRKLGPRDVIVEIAAAGLCHSDLSYMHGLYPVPSPARLRSRGRRHRRRGRRRRHPREARRPRRDRHRRQLRLLRRVRGRAAHVVPPEHRQRHASRSPSTASRCSNFAVTTRVRRAHRRARRAVREDPRRRAAHVGRPRRVRRRHRHGRGVQPGQRAARRSPPPCSASAASASTSIQALKVQGASTIIAVDTVAEKERPGQAVRRHRTSSTARATTSSTPSPPSRRSATTQCAGRSTPAASTGRSTASPIPPVTWNALECLDWGGTVVVIGVPARPPSSRVSTPRLTQVDRGDHRVPLRHDLAAPRHPADHRALPPRRDPARRARHPPPTRSSEYEEAVARDRVRHRRPRRHHVLSVTASSPAGLLAAPQRSRATFTTHARPVRRRGRDRARRRGLRRRRRRGSRSASGPRRPTGVADALPSSGRHQGRRRRHRSCRADRLRHRLPGHYPRSVRSPPASTRGSARPRSTTSSSGASRSSCIDAALTDRRSPPGRGR